MPSTSLRRGCRVVADTECRSRGANASTARAISLDFPLPAGPETIISGPTDISIRDGRKFATDPVETDLRSVRPSPCAGPGRIDQRSVPPLFHVLHQLADLFQRRLDLDHLPGHAHVPGLRSD